MHGIHQPTFDAVFQHPIARNLQWRDVRSMLVALSDSAEEQSSGNFKFTRNGQTLVVHPPRRKDFSDVQELMDIRHFLSQSSAPGDVAAPAGTHLLVVIDHREARIFQTELHGSVPQRIAAYNPEGAHRHLHNVENDSNGQRKPEPKAYYDAIARTLDSADSILIFGSGTGSSSAMDHLAAELKEHHPKISKKLVGTVVVNEQHMSDDQLLAEARSFYGTRQV